MKLQAGIERFAVGSLYGLALFGAISMIQLSTGHAFTAYALPLSLCLGYLLATPRTPQAQTARERLPWWVLPLCLVLIGSVTVALCYGSLATPSRHWDGAVAWEIKADYLTRQPGLDQDFFTRAGVYHHSRGYPLLQPVCIAAGNRLFGDGRGRALFPCLYLVLLALAGMTLRRRCSRSWLVPAGVLALGLTPMLVNPVMGGADSGFAELFLATAVAGIAAGLVLNHRSLLATAIFLAVLVKPEGLVYGALPTMILWYRRERAAMRAALLGYCLALTIWLPLRHELLQFCQGNGIAASVIAGVLGLAALVLLSDILLTRREIGPRGRALTIVLFSLATLLAATLLVPSLGGQGGTLGAYLSDPGRIVERLPRIPQIIIAYFYRGIFHLRFATIFALFTLILGEHLWNRRKLPEPRLAAFTILGLLSLFLVFLLSPEEDLRHLIHASMDRLLLHWLAPVCVLSMLCIDAGEPETIYAST